MVNGYCWTIRPQSQTIKRLKGIRESQELFHSYLDFRYAKRTEHIRQLQLIHDKCKQHDIKFKINSVVCSANWKEDLSEMIQTLDPCRWKVMKPHRTKFRRAIVPKICLAAENFVRRKFLSAVSAEIYFVG